MTIENWLVYSAEKLRISGTSSPKLDVELLLSDLFDKDRSWLHAHPDFELTSEQLRFLDGQLKRRINHEPVAYIRGKQEFYGRIFKVSPDTLTPRPETETMVSMALEILNNQRISSVADIGTGSGCIVISLDLESKRNVTFTGYDVSDSALIIAKGNAKQLKSNVIFKKSDILSETEDGWQKTEMIVANLPYVPEDYQINLAASHEPRLAIFGGKDGLDIYRALFRKLESSVSYILTEALPPQHQVLANIAKQAGFKQIESQDLIQVFRKI